MLFTPEAEVEFFFLLVLQGCFACICYTRKLLFVIHMWYKIHYCKQTNTTLITFPYISYEGTPSFHIYVDGCIRLF